MIERSYEAMNISERIEAWDELVEGIVHTFLRWEEEVRSDVKSEVDEILVQQEPKKNPTTEKENLYYNSTSDGIIYILKSWIDGEKWSEILVMIDGEKLCFTSFGFSEKWENFSVWIEPKETIPSKTQFQLKNNTFISHKNLKAAIEKMLRLVRSILKSKDPKKQALASEIRKFKKES